MKPAFPPKPLGAALLGAVLYISKRPICADPYELRIYCQVWLLQRQPITYAECFECGELAARDCALPMKTVKAKLIEPKDLL